MKLDVQVVSREAFADVRRLLEPKAKELKERGAVILVRLRLLEEHVQGTLEDLEKADAHTAEALRWDLENVLPARKKALVSAVEAELGSGVKAVAEALLEVAVKVAIVVARSVLPIP